MERKVYTDGEKTTHIVVQDYTPTLEDNKQARDSQKEHFKYLNGKLLFHACSIDMGFIEQMANGQCCSDGIKYRFMTNDKEEKKRALLHVQGTHPGWMRVKGKPFAKDRSVWI